MSELRRDPILKQWVVVHTDNSWPPEKFDREDHVPRHQLTCQFCPGREHMTPPEVDVIRQEGSKPNGPGWRVRVVPNKFPVLKIEGNLEEKSTGLLDWSNGIGAHEVLIETPDHDRNFADFSEQEAADVIAQYQSRLIDLSRDKRFRYIAIFKNYGESAGTTVEHAHSQIIALPRVPKYVLEELSGAQEYFQQHQRCVFCDMLVQEDRDQLRIISRNRYFTAFCPFVPRYAFEYWILPREHRREFSAMAGEERAAFAAILRETLRRLKKCLGDPAYNFYLHLPPVNDRMGEHYHWHMEIVPQLTRVSGFEWGTGFYAVRTEPSLAARYLREIQ